MNEMRVEFILYTDTVNSLDEFPMFIMNDKLSKKNKLVYDANSNDIDLAIKFIAYFSGNSKNVKEAILWDYIERDTQNNGELSYEKMKSLAGLKTSYCWSII